MTPTVLDYYRGDTWRGCTFNVTYNGGAPPNPAASVLMQFRRLQEVITLSSSGGSPKIIITNAANWTITVVPHVLPISTEGDWLFDCQVTDTAGNITTIAKGILKVEADVTQ